MRALRRLLRVWVALGAVVCVPWCVAQVGMYRIAGKVVSADGRPVAGAKVVLADTVSRRQAGAVVAGEDGSFAFDGLAAGKFTLQGSAPGYLTSLYEQHGQFSSAIVTGGDVSSEGVVLRLLREGSVSGRIRDETGEGVRHGQVGLYFEDTQQGMLRVTRMNAAQTDDLGQYSFVGLRPGRYFVSVTAKPWYAVYPSTVSQAAVKMRGQGGVEFGVLSKVDAGLDVAYPMTFYPASRDAASASALVVTGGAEVEADIALTPVQAVTLTVPALPGKGAMSFPQLQADVFGRPEPVQVEARNDGTGAMTLAGVAPGRYTLHREGGVGAMTSDTPVDASGSAVQVGPPREIAMAKVKVTVTAPGGETVPREAVELVRRDGTGNIGQMTLMLNAKSEVELPRVAPGEYSIHLRQGNVRATIVAPAAADVGRCAVANGYVRVAGVDCTVVVRTETGKGIVEGVAATGGKPAVGAMVLLLPAGPVFDTRVVWRDQSDLDGSFVLRQVPPGTYLLMAIEGGWEMEWQRQDVLQRFMEHSTVVTVKAGAEGKVTLGEQVVVQQAAR